MTLPALQFPFVETDPKVGSASRMPYLPVTLSLGQRSLQVSGLADTGAAINVLPNSIGLRLGAVWDQQPTSVQLSGNLASVEARVLVVMAVVGNFPAVQLAFAWAKSDGMPVIFGEVNFFMEFDACFFRSRSVFEVRPKA